MDGVDTLITTLAENGGFPALVAGGLALGWFFHAKQSKEEHRKQIELKDQKIDELNGKLLNQATEYGKSLFDALSVLREASAQLLRQGRS